MASLSFLGPNQNTLYPQGGASPNYAAMNSLPGMSAPKSSSTGTGSPLGPQNQQLPSFAQPWSNPWSNPPPAPKPATGTVPDVTTNMGMPPRPTSGTSQPSQGMPGNVNPSFNWGAWQPMGQQSPIQWPNWGSPNQPNYMDPNTAYGGDPSKNFAANTYNQWYGQAFDPGMYADKNAPYARMLENSLPVAQLQQNSYQYSNDFNEAQRRFNMEYGRNMTNDEYQRWLSTRQQNAAELQAQQAASQWGQQFDWTKQGDLFSQGLANKQFGLESQLGLGNLGVAQAGQQAQANYWTGQNQNQAFSNTTERMGVQNQFSLGQQANQIDQMWKAGQLTQQQKELALAQLTQQQNYNIQQGQLGNQLAGFASEERIAQRNNLMQQYGIDAQTAQNILDNQTAQRGQTLNLQGQMAGYASEEKIAQARNLVERYGINAQTAMNMVNAQTAQRGQDLDLRGQMAGYASDERVAAARNLTERYGIDAQTAMNMVDNRTAQRGQTLDYQAALAGLGTQERGQTLDYKAALAGLSAQERMNAADNLVQRYGIDKQAAMNIVDNQTQMQGYASQERMNAADNLMKRYGVDADTARNLVNAQTQRYGIDVGARTDLGVAGVRAGADVNIANIGAQTSIRNTLADNLMKQYGIDANTAISMADRQLGYAQLSDTGQQWRAGLGEQTRSAMVQEQLEMARQRQAELLQQAELASQERQAAMAAFGRAQPMTSRWVRNWS